MLKVENLVVKTDNKIILNGISFECKQGEVTALMGPNGSGKSTLAYVLMGHPKYEVVSGRIYFKGQDISDLNPDERAKLGLFLSFQHPNEISGVIFANFLRTALNDGKPEEEQISAWDFHKILREKAEFLGIDKEMLRRSLNEGFSGGEKKRAEILQMLMLNPEFAILDEPDSGLDIDALKHAAKGINEFSGEDKSVLIITHYKRILEHVKPDKLIILKDGKIIREGYSDLVNELEEHGYGRVSSAE